MPEWKVEAKIVMYIFDEVLEEPPGAWDVQGFLIETWGASIEDVEIITCEEIKED